MKFVLIAITTFCLEIPMLMGQAANVVNSGRSNIKNNIVLSHGPDKRVHCTVSDKPCTKEDVAKLNAALAGEQMRAVHAKTNASPASGVKSVALSPDGSLSCVTNDGKEQACTTEHMADLNKAAAAMPRADDPVPQVGIGLGDKKTNPSQK